MALSSENIASLTKKLDDGDKEKGVDLFFGLFGSVLSLENKSVPFFLDRLQE
ncbi:hypothetical protein JLK41_11775 [Ectopseudomonas khazarica]|uniref:hypothetical protein n=1 Tax=Ectopseudomonas khazarica TaxID=2502979 RepID=UPI001AEF9449|nr:hypothetical protein [Pseudomonas khazarica]QTS88789.1 hypothetical protein JLK41_11775 [Pseudomonas khazarica]